jgi:hypothetical protein
VIAIRELPIRQRRAALEWQKIADSLALCGYAVIEHILDENVGAALAESYSSREIFHSRVVMDRFGYGRGEYKYFAYPLPEIIHTLRTDLYPPLAEIANRWDAAMTINVYFPAEHAAFLVRCHEAGQSSAYC